MKKITLLLLGSFLAFGAMAQPTFVSTTPSNKNVVLEEYTGINCGNCPDGHKIANDIAAANPERVVLINIHQGGYAYPGQGQPDFRTIWGNALAAQTNLSGYPSGTVNRRVFAGGVTALDRGSWNQAAGIVMAEPSFVNVASRAFIDTVTRIITVDVEIYYTGDATTNINMLNVALLQDSIFGPQVSMTSNPTQVVNGQYLHMHMLRHLFSNQYGDPLVGNGAVINSGTFFSKRYVYELPQHINNIPLILKDLHVVAFIAKNTQEIYTGAAAEMNWGEYTNEVNDKVFAVLQASSNISDCSGETDAILSFTVKNEGSEPINNIVVKYKEANSDNFLSLTYSTAVNAGEVANIALPGLTIPYDNAVKNYFAYIFELNDLDVNSPDMHGGAFYGNLKSPHPTKDAKGDITLYLKTDKYGSETKWKIQDANGNIIKQGGPYQDGAYRFDTVTFNFTEKGCYIFTITDSWGDGLLGSNPPGSYKIVDRDGITIGQSNGAFGAQEQRPINITSTIGLEDVDGIITSMNIYPNPVKDIATLDINLAQSSNATIQVMDLMGRSVIELGTKSLRAGQTTMEINTSDLTNGMYFVKVCTNNGVITKKITINK